MNDFPKHTIVDQCNSAAVARLKHTEYTNACPRCSAVSSAYLTFHSGKSSIPTDDIAEERTRPNIVDDHKSSHLAASCFLPASTTYLIIASRKNEYLASHPHPNPGIRGPLFLQAPEPVQTHWQGPVAPRSPRPPSSRQHQRSAQARYPRSSPLAQA